MPFCPNCGVESRPDASYCPVCGATLSDRPVGVMDDGTHRELPYYLSLNRVLLMTVLSGGLYLFYWFYLTWKQYRDYTGDEAYPVWHALTLLVPIYNLFRTHAHARTYRALMWEYELPCSIRPGWAWVLGLIAILASNLSWRGYISQSVGPEPLTLGAVVFFLILDLISMAMIAILLVHLQSNINRYWHSRTNGRVRSARIGVGEIIFGIIGVLGWLSTLADLFSESWRTGF